jgi:hypothetical protein
MNDHKQPKLTKTEQRLANLEQMVQMINIGCLSEIRGLMLTLKVKPDDFVKNVNDSTAMQVLARNLENSTEAYKAHNKKEEPLKVKTDFNKPTLEIND